MPYSDEMFDKRDDMGRVAMILDSMRNSFVPTLHKVKWFEEYLASLQSRCARLDKITVEEVAKVMLVEARCGVITNETLTNAFWEATSNKTKQTLMRSARAVLDYIMKDKEG